MVKRRIVILGAGFVGIRCVQDLAMSIDLRKFELILVDKNRHHVFYADLYEVATAFKKMTGVRSVVKLKDTVALPVKSLISQGVKFICANVSSINFKDNIVRLGSKKLNYDFLVVGLGSETNYYNIPGLKANSLPLKSLSDALKINSEIESLFDRISKDKQERDLYVTIGGGGATGVEFVAELKNSLKILLEKYDFSEQNIHLRLLDGGDFLGGIDKKGTSVIEKRLLSLGVEVLKNCYIKKVNKKSLIVERDGSEEKILSDLNIWTGGVKVSEVLGQKIEVNEYLQSVEYQNVFAGGDNADSNCPMLAQVAYQQGRVIAHNLLNLIANKELERFSLKKVHFILPIGGKFAVWKMGEKIWKGYIPWFIRRFVYLRYLMTIMPFNKAIKKWYGSQKVFVQND